MTPVQQPEVRVRFAPSPTGHWHVGGVRTTLFNWLFARKHGGKVILRVEDTDTARSKQEFEVEIIEALAWLGIDYDEGPKWRMENGEWRIAGSKGEYGPYRQSERTDLYKKYLEQLLAERKAYYCYCSKDDLEAERQARAAEGLPPKYGGHCRTLERPPAGKLPEAIRFAIPETTVACKDLIRGTVSFDAGLFGDVIIAKSTTAPLYNFAVVVDDELMKITHVIRGEEHLGNTPKQILIQRALGFQTPIYAHVPLILNQDRSKMSKRYAETSILGYRDEGYLPEALVNFLPLLGWHPKDDREILTLQELTAQFDLARVQKGGAVFSEDKLNWTNQQYLKKLSDVELAERIKALNGFSAETLRGFAPEFFTRAVAVIRDRMKTLKDFESLASFFFSLPDYEPQLLVWKDDAPTRTRESLLRTSGELKALPPQEWQKDGFLTALAPLAEELGRGSVFWPLRVAVSGQAASPDPMQIMEVLGKTETMNRLDLALRKLNIA